MYFLLSPSFMNSINLSIQALLFLTEDHGDNSFLQKIFPLGTTYNGYCL